MTSAGKVKLLVTLWFLFTCWTIAKIRQDDKVFDECRGDLVIDSNNCSAEAHCDGPPKEHNYSRACENYGYCSYRCIPKEYQ